MVGKSLGVFVEKWRKWVQKVRTLNPPRNFQKTEHNLTNRYKKLPRFVKMMKHKMEIRFFLHHTFCEPLFFSRNLRSLNMRIALNWELEGKGGFPFPPRDCWGTPFFPSPNHFAVRF